jgi:hypothetical protein
MYSAPVDQTVFQTIIFAVLCWFIYTFLYKPVVYEHEPYTFTTEEIIKIIQTGVNDFYAERDQATLSANALSLDLCKSILSLEDKLAAVQRRVESTPCRIESIPRKLSFDELDIATTLAGLKYSPMEVGMKRERRSARINRL